MMRIFLLALALVVPSGANAIGVPEAKRIIAGQLKDPDSVHFRNVKAFKRTGAVCGEYNAKNSFGGYVGFVPFGVSGDGSLMEAPNLEGLNASYAESATALFLKQCAGTE